MQISSLKKYLLVVVTGSFFLMFASCGNEPIPKGMPKLYPARIIVLQEGKPLNGATIILVNIENLQTPWTVGGLTDGNGICKLKTLGKFNGVPIGKYKVTVEKNVIQESETSKLPIPTDPQAREEYYAKIRTEEKFYDRVNLKYKSPTTTDLEIEIVGSKNEKTFDVGKEIKQKVILIGQ
ncbi:MAG: carboxypeptidase-like regulatory domain-containing protein [Planctomycetaceae bacterium]|jgi:hypothetical protein|nr:carboxypeptidase-like regulatory domain-containing protein [Planctomycetaceae bacterium]